MTTTQAAIDNDHAIATAPTYESDFVCLLVELDNSYPDCKRDKMIRDVFGTGAYLNFANGHYSIRVSI